LNNGELPLKDSQKKAFFVSAAFHAAFLLFLVAQTVLAQQATRSSKKLLVQSVALKTHKTSPRKIEAPPAPPAQEVASSEPQEKIPEPSEASEPLQEESPPEKPAQKEVSSAPEEAAPSPKQKAAPKQTVSKKAAPAPSKKGKIAPKPTGKAVSSKPNKKQTAPSYDTRLVAEAIDRLNKSHKAAQSSGTGSGGGKGGSGKVSRVGSVGALHSDIGIASQEGADDEPEFSETSSEGCYITDLIRRLQLSIRLAEPGEIRIKLTLKKNGQVDSIAVVSCKNEKIKRSLLEKLKTIHFSPFGQSFPGEAEHTFLLKLSNDLSWSCF
jgi:outer membrane biosynthesis protein TonB